MEKTFKYINFAEVMTTKDSKRKTAIYECRNNRSGDVLGWVKWYGPWRQYCFFTRNGMVFNTGCLEDIQTFIKSLPRKTSTERPIYSWNWFVSTAIT